MVVAQRCWIASVLQNTGFSKSFIIIIVNFPESFLGYKAVRLYDEWNEKCVPRKMFDERYS